MSLVDADGAPLRKSSKKGCPRCGSGDDKRAPSGGFGVVHPVCILCGHEFIGEPYEGR